MPVRIRFMVQDIVDLRRNKWATRRAGKDMERGPRTIQQVRNGRVIEQVYPKSMDWNDIIILSNLFRFARTRLVMVLFTCLKKTLLRLKECRPWRRLPLLGGLWQTFFLHLVSPNQVLLTIINILCFWVFQHTFLYFPGQLTAWKIKQVRSSFKSTS